MSDVIGKIEMQPLLANVIFRDPARGDEANYRSLLAEMSGVPESEIVDLRFDTLNLPSGRTAPIVRYAVEVHYSPLPREARVLFTIDEDD